MLPLRNKLIELGVYGENITRRRMIRYVNTENPIQDYVDVVLPFGSDEGQRLALAPLANFLAGYINVFRVEPKEGEKSTFKSDKPWFYIIWNYGSECKDGIFNDGHPVTWVSDATVESGGRGLRCDLSTNTIINKQTEADVTN